MYTFLVTMFYTYSTYFTRVGWLFSHWHWSLVDTVWRTSYATDL